MTTSKQKDPRVKSRITSGEKFLYFTTIIGVAFAAYLIISTYASIYITNSEIHALERSINNQVTNNEALQLQVTELSAPDRILQIATEQLGMTLNDKNVKVVQN
ncbi:cell division protein FtsL [Anaerobacillus sp. CMMVII]|nr:cell division protein FtsL [Anaerobacillus sp. CMMVII]